MKKEINYFSVPNIQQTNCKQTYWKFFANKSKPKHPFEPQKQNERDGTRREKKNTKNYLWFGTRLRPT